ncbi:MAG: TrmH family RNA methyltransferase [Bacteroidetes bacterium]|nr:TrmH family RNA methyltransferase [Bacteroidota bacterium]
MQKLRNEELGRKTIEDYKQSQKIPVTVILENVRSALNVGSVFRSADSFLIEKIILTGFTATPPHKEVLKTALGATESVDWEYIPESHSVIKLLRDKNYSVYAIEQVVNSLKLNNIKLNINPVAIIFGNEVGGVSQETINLCDGCIEVEQFGTKHSLNISVCAGIVLYHFSGLYRK